MCGRYHHSIDDEVVEKTFKIKIQEGGYKPNYNAAPSQTLPLVASNNSEILQAFRWGLIPSWSKDETIGFKMINARVETIQEKPSFKSLVNKNRCAVIADGYYEWQKLDAKTKQPMRICMNDKSPFAFAGLWTEWKNPEGKLIPTFTIITTDAHKEIAHIHDRMPVMMNPEIINAWLLNEMNIDQLQKEMIQGKELIYYPVSSLVGNVKYNNAELINRID
jgi:putative SOS response-associated peptidase YedK